MNVSATVLLIRRRRRKQEEGDGMFKERGMNTVERKILFVR